MKAAIDTNVIEELLDQPKLQGPKRYGTALDEYLSSHRLQIGLDGQGGVVDEWGRTCGEEYIKALVIE